MKHKHFAAAQYATHSSVHLLYEEYISACVVVVEWDCASYRGMLNESPGVPILKFRFFELSVCARQCARSDVRVVVV